MLKLTVIALFMMLLPSCNQKTESPSFFSTTFSPNDGSSGDNSGDDNGGTSDPPTQPPTITLTSSISYSTNIIEEDTYLVDEQATYTIPSLLVASFGNAGQGWLQLDIDTIRYCYLGAAKKLSQVTLQYNLIHSTSDQDNSCSISLNTNLIPELSVEIFNGDTVNLDLEEGICGKKCLDTEVSITLIPN